jgi:peptidoglycan/xylan/chitin deacetylase (PgdA/CDA1 family)
MIEHGLTTLRRAARQLRDRFTPGALILLYHRVAELPSDPQRVCVTRQHFAEHLEILRESARPMELREMVRALRDNKLPRRAVVLTFDDGYADNLLNGKPLLERHDVPSTFFVTTGYLGHDREFWWDELERLFLQPGTLPQQLCLAINGRPHQWNLGEGAHYSADAYRRNCTWNVEKQENPTPRQHVYRSLCSLLCALPDREQRTVLDALMAWAGTEPVWRPTHRTLTPDEVCHLAKDGHVEVGSHTVTHPILSSLLPAEQREEAQGSKTCLEEILGRPVTSFAYPYGTRSDYTAETVDIVREAGYDRACSNFDGLVRQGTDPWQLPRFLVRDWDGEEFTSRLTAWLGA